MARVELDYSPSREAAIQARFGNSDASKGKRSPTGPVPGSPLAPAVPGPGPAPGSPLHPAIPPR